jgi:hypothetical protein
VALPAKQNASGRAELDDTERTITHSGRLRQVIAGAFAISCTWCGLAVADEIRIEAMRCSPEVHLVAQNVHLSTVLERLAEKLQFKVHFESAGDPFLSVDSRGPVDDLLALVTPSKSISMTAVRDPNCRDQQRILEIWVLPQGREDGTSRAAAPQTIPAQPLLTAQEGEALYLRAHGFDPGGQGTSQ